MNVLVPLILFLAGPQCDRYILKVFKKKKKVIPWMMWRIFKKEDRRREKKGKGQKKKKKEKLVKEKVIKIFLKKRVHRAGWHAVYVEL